MFLYPQEPAECNDVGILDVIDSVLYETFEFTGTAADPFFPSLFPFARLILGDGYIRDNGYVYATGQWNKVVIERQREAGTLQDHSFTIDEGTDGYLGSKTGKIFLWGGTRRIAGPPPSVFLEGHVGRLDEPFFSNRSGREQVSK